MQHLGVNSCLQVGRRGVSDLQHRGVKSCLQVGWQGVSDLRHQGVKGCLQVSRRGVSSLRHWGWIFLFYKRLYIILFLYSKHKNIETCLKNIIKHKKH